MTRSRRGWGSVRRPRPGGRWQARYLDPETHRLVPAASTFATKAEADRWLAHKRSELDRGAVIDERVGAQPLAHWWPGYLKSLSGLKSSTVNSYEIAWRLRVQPEFGSTPVRRIRVTQVEDWIAEHSNEGLSASKVLETYGIETTAGQGPPRPALPHNPCGNRSTRLPRHTVKDRPVLSPAEVDELASAMKHPFDGTLVRVLAYGGLRIGEAFALQHQDFDASSHTIRVHRSVRDASGHIEVGDTKTYAARTVTLPGSLARELAAHLAGSPSDALIFPGRGGTHRRYRNFRRDAWDPAAHRASLDITPHDLRATCASLLVDAGASIKDVQAHLGHADITTTLSLYARVRPGRSADLAKRLDVLIAEA